ncbi:MAG: phosphatidylglycerophosphatase A [Alphaproteobacteria bacterium]
MTKAQNTLKWAWLIATWFKSGLSPKAPGTMGSLCALPLVWLMVSLYGTAGVIISTVLIFIIGLKATALVLKQSTDTDPGYVVIDEVVGQLLTFIFIAHLPISPWMYVLGFAFFRFFDIMKPWPAAYFDKHVHTAVGVMMDDVCAGLYAGAVLGFIYYVI